MSRRVQRRRGALDRLDSAWKRLVGELRIRLAAALRWWRPGQVQVIVADRRRRRAVAGEVRSALRRLRCLLGEQLPDDLMVLVQEVVQADQQLAGCTRITRHPAGSRQVVIQVALKVDGRRLSADELLASLADQCVALAVQDAGGLAVVIPFESRTPARPDRETDTVPAPDPFEPRPNGRAWSPGRGAA